MKNEKTLNITGFNISKTTKLLLIFCSLSVLLSSCKNSSQSKNQMGIVPNLVDKVGNKKSIGIERQSLSKVDKSKISKNEKASLVGIDEDGSLLYNIKQEDGKIIEIKTNNRKELSNVKNNRKLETFAKKADVRDIGSLIFPEFRVDTFPDIHFKWHVSVISKAGLSQGLQIADMTDFNGNIIKIAIEQNSYKPLDLVVGSTSVTNDPIYFHFQKSKANQNPNLITIDADVILSDDAGHHGSETFAALEIASDTIPIVSHFSKVPLVHTHAY